MAFGGIKRIARLFKEAYQEWSDDKATRLGAALSYYTLFSLAPLLIVALAVAGLAFGHEAASGQVMAQLRDLIGDQGAAFVQQLIRSSDQPKTGIIATIIGLVTLFIGATGVFLELQGALNTVWEVQRPGNSGWSSLIKDRLISFGLVIGVGFLLLVSLLVSAAIAALAGWLTRLWPALPILWEAAHFLISLGVITTLFAMIYKFLPDVALDWRDVWEGAAITAVFFTIGKFLIGLYLGHSSVASTYGAAGSVIVLLVWVYYSAQVMLFGAEFTQVIVRNRGEVLAPKGDAKHIDEKDPMDKGKPVAPVAVRRPAHRPSATPRSPRQPSS